MALIATTLGVGYGAWKALRSRRPPATVQGAKTTEPLPLSPDAFPERVAGKPLENKYLASSLKPTDDDIRALIDGVQFDQWYGLYSRKRKLGFGREVMRKTAQGEPGAYFSSFDMAMRTGFRGDVSYDFEAAYYSGEPPFRLVAVRFRSKSAEGDVVREFSFGEREGKLTETVDGETKPVRTVPATRDTLTAVFAESVAGPEHVKPGDTASFPMFDPELIKDDQTEITVIAVGERKVNGVDLTIAELTVHTASDDTSVTARVARGGRPLDTKLQQFSFQPEPREVAVSIVELSTDAGALD